MASTSRDTEAQPPSTGRTVHYLDDGTPYLAWDDDDFVGVFAPGVAVIDLADGAGRQPGPGIDAAVREYVDRELADAPPGSVVEIVVTSNTHAGPLRLGTYTFSPKAPS